MLSTQHWGPVSVTTLLPDVDSGPRGPCVVAVMDKFTWTTEVLWRKRDGMAALSKWERGLRPLPGQAFIAFMGTLH